MKYIFFIFLFVSIAIFSCKEYPCRTTFFQVGFINFSQVECDTIIFKKYSKSTNFNTLLDSIIFIGYNTNYNWSGDSVLISLPLNNFDEYTAGLSSEYDYKIFLPEPNRVFAISEITEEKITKKSGISLDKIACYNLIKSYKVNNQLISGESNYTRAYFTK